MKKCLFLFSVLLGLFSCTKEATILPQITSASISIQKDNEAIITLPIGSSPGSTGVVWYVATSPNEKIAEIDEGQIAENIKPSEIWGTHIWKITGVSKGTTKIKLKFGRPTVPDEFYGEYDINIKVTN